MQLSVDCKNQCKNNLLIFLLGYVSSTPQEIKHQPEQIQGGETGLEGCNNMVDQAPANEMHSETSDPLPSTSVSNGLPRLANTISKSFKISKAKSKRR